MSNKWATNFSSFQVHGTYTDGWCKIDGKPLNGVISVNYDISGDDKLAGVVTIKTYCKEIEFLSMPIAVQTEDIVVTPDPVCTKAELEVRIAHCEKSLAVLRGKWDALASTRVMRASHATAIVKETT